MRTHATIRRAFAGLVAVALCLGAAGCSLPGPDRSAPKQTRSSAEPERNEEPVTGTLANIQVTGTWGFRPEIEFTPPLKIDQPDQRTLIYGDGTELKHGGKALLAIYAQSASNGDVLRDDFSTLPQVYRVTPSSLGQDLYDVLLGVRGGSRVVHITYDVVPLIMVVDVLPLRATGTDVENPTSQSADGAELPTVKDRKIIIPEDSVPPAMLSTAVLRIGSGQQVRAGQRAVLQYQAVRWSNGRVVGTTWDKDELPVTVKIGSDVLIEGLDAALTDVAVGSRILVVVPPGLAFGLSDGRWRDETMVYLIDVLAASGENDDDADDVADKADSNEEN